jgi:CRP-like cAMP-binding protein
MTGDQKRSRKRKPKAQVRYLASKIVCLNLDSLLGKTEAATRIMDQLPAPKNLKTGEAIRFPSPLSAVLVKEGALDIMLPGDFDQVPVKRLGPGFLFGEIPLLGMRTSGAQAVAAEDCQIVILDQETLRTISLASRAIASRVIDALGRRLLESEVDQVIKQFGTTDSRLIRLLPKLADENGVIDDVSQRDLAYMLETTRQEVNEAMGRLKQRGVVETSRMRIKLLAVDKSSADELIPFPNHGEGGCR